MLGTKAATDRLKQLGLSITPTHLLGMVRNGRFSPPRVGSGGEYDWESIFDAVAAWATVLEAKRVLRRPPIDLRLNLFSPLTATPLDATPAGVELNGWVHSLWVAEQDWPALKKRKRLDSWMFPDYSGTWADVGRLLESVKATGKTLFASTRDTPAEVCRRAILCRHHTGFKGDPICG